MAQLVPASAAQAEADPGSDSLLSWQFSPYSLHFTQDEAHKRVVMVGLEREHGGAKLDGITLFTNSFGQPTIYLYPWGGVYHSIGGVERLSFKWTAGLLYGYRQPYENKVPLNFRGLSPAFIPALAYGLKRGVSVQVNFLGTAGLMFQVNMPFK